jgi:hypothetical protein
MATIKEYLDYAELAQASYSDLTKGMFGKDDKLYKNALKAVKKAEFSPLQAKNFASRYKVLAVADSIPTGLDAVLFGEVNSSGQVIKTILSIRGTSSLSDVYSDILLAEYGVAYDQLTSLNSFYNQWVEDGIIPQGTKIDVTGHSLGGALAQSFATAHPNTVNSIYSYNAPGIGGLSTEAYEVLGITPSSLGQNNIYNIYAKEGISVTSGLGTLLGTKIPVSIDDGYLVQNHSISRLTESLHIYNMLSSIANTQDINLLTSIVENVSNKKVIQAVEGVFSEQQSGNTVDQAINLTKNHQGKAAGLTNLTNKTLSQLNSKDSANLYALLHLNPFAIQGNLPAYKEIDPHKYSDMQMDDLSQMLYSSMHKEHKSGYTYRNLITGESVVNTPSINQVMFGGDDDDFIRGGSGDDHIYGNKGNDIIYGDSSNTYITKEGNDYIEGGSGTDTIYGNGGNDTLLGGADTDYLLGESGSDTLLGGDDNASDILVGGSGEDVLLGQGGDDILVGGNSLEDIYSEKVSDYLSGGSGYDTYYVSHQDIISKSFKKVA